VKRAGVLAAVGFVIGCAVGAFLWRYWTRQCNEACPGWVALAMQGFVVVLPLACATTGAVLGSTRYPRTTRWILLALMVAVSGVLAFWLTQSGR
jgi:hypothetical protein